MTDQTQADLVLERFGGFAAMAEKTGFSEQTIRNWVRAKTIPQKHHLDILIAARSYGVQLLPHDLVTYLVNELIAAAQAGDSTTPGTPPVVAG
jgi:hypothetical protein